MLTWRMVLCPHKPFLLVDALLTQENKSVLMVRKETSVQYFDMHVSAKNHHSLSHLWILISVTLPPSSYTFPHPFSCTLPLPIIFTPPCFTTFTPILVSFPPFSLCFQSIHTAVPLSLLLCIPPPFIQWIALLILSELGFQFPPP